MESFNFSARCARLASHDSGTESRLKLSENQRCEWKELPDNGTESRNGIDQGYWLWLWLWLKHMRWNGIGQGLG